MRAGDGPSAANSELTGCWKDGAWAAEESRAAVGTKKDGFAGLAAGVGTRGGSDAWLAVDGL